MSDMPGGNPAAEPDEVIEDDLENPEAEEIIADDDEGSPDEGAADDGDGEEGEGQERQARNVTRPAGRGPRGRSYGEQIRQLEAARAADKAAFDQQLQQLLAERRQPSAAEIAAQAEAERQRLEMMSPVEVAAYYHQKTLTEVSHQTQRMQMQLWDQGDRREYDAFLETRPAWRSLNEKVEELRRQAPGVSRKILLATAYGMRAQEQEAAATGRARRSAEAGRERHTVRPSRPGGDVAADRGRRGDNLDARLRNQSI